LKVQLWCYGKIDDWASAPRVSLVGNIYDVKRDLNYPPMPVGGWDRDDPLFDQQCAELFEIYNSHLEAE
jgi:hypothetical protein